MPEPSKKSDRMGALFLLGLLLFNPPLLNIFDAGPGVTFIGIPILYLYLFTAWAVLVGLMGLVIERKPKPKSSNSKEQ